MKVLHSSSTLPHSHLSLNPSLSLPTLYTLLEFRYYLSVFPTFLCHVLLLWNTNDVNPNLNSLLVISNKVHQVWMKTGWRSIPSRFIQVFFNRTLSKKLIVLARLLKMMAQMSCFAKTQKQTNKKTAPMDISIFVHVIWISQLQNTLSDCINMYSMLLFLETKG